QVVPVSFWALRDKVLVRVLQPLGGWQLTTELQASSVEGIDLPTKACEERVALLPKETMEKLISTIGSRLEASNGHLRYSHQSPPHQANQETWKPDVCMHSSRCLSSQNSLNLCSLLPAAVR
ncbi:unnamed protein product, partial [Chrysoparadoxa australica]